MSVAGPAPELRRLLSRRVLYLIILPTERCQLRCTYCFQEYQRGRMAPEIVRGIERWIARRADHLRHLVLDWYGGEPLLAADTVERVQGFAAGLAGERPWLTVRGMMTTNAMLLDPRRLRSLTAAGVRTYQITLDGPAEVHDRFRIRADGGGTFERIWSNLVAARDTTLDFVVHLRLHVSEVSVEAQGALLRRIGETFGGDERFRISLRPLFQPGTTDRSAPVLGGDRRRRQALAGLSALADDLGLTRQEGPFEGPMPRAGCYAAAASSFVVRPDGELGKCTLALGHPRNRVGRLLPDGTIERDAVSMDAWLRGVRSGDIRELQCPAQGWLFPRPDAARA